MDEEQNLQQSEQEEGQDEEGMEMSFIARIAGVFLDPRKTFLSLEHKPDFIVPLVLLALVVFVCTWAAWPVIEASSMEMMQERLLDRGMEQDQIDQFMEQQQKFGKVSGLAGGPVSTFFIALIVSGILLFAGNIVMGGNSTYKQMLCVYSYSSLIGIIAYIIRTILMMMKGTIHVYTSLAALFPLDMKDSMVFKTAGIFDVFTIWKIIVIAIGMGVMYRMDFKKPLIVVGALYLIFAAVSMNIMPGG